jgi:hypothetical protein
LLPSERERERERDMGLSFKDAANYRDYTASDVDELNMGEELWCYNANRGKKKCTEKILPLAILSTTNSTRNCMQSTWLLCCEKPAIKRLRSGINFKGLTILSAQV